MALQGFIKNNKTYVFTYTGTLAVATGVARLYFEETLTIKSVRASVGTTPAGSTIIIDVNKNGSTIFSTQANRPTIAIAGSTSGLITNMNTTSIVSGDYLTIDIDQVGSTSAGADLTVQVTVA